MIMILFNQFLGPHADSEPRPEDFHVGLAGTVGAALIGHIISLFLNAFTWIQTVIYFQRNYDDWIVFKTIVVIICLLGLVHEALVTQGLYVYLVTFRGNSMGVLHPQWSFGAQVYVTELNNVIIRSVYAYRIWRLSTGKLQRAVVLLIVVLSCYTFGTSCVFATMGVTTMSWLDNQNLTWAVYSSYGVEIIADGMIAASMSLLLLRLRTGLTGSDSILQRFMAYSLYTGLLTTIFVALTMTTYIAYPRSFIYLSFYFVFSKLYAISLLGFFNARTLITDPACRTTSQMLTTAIMLEGGSQPTLLSAAGEMADVRSRTSLEVVFAKADWEGEDYDLESVSARMQTSLLRDIHVEPRVPVGHATHPRPHKTSSTESVWHANSNIKSSIS